MRKWIAFVCALALTAALMPAAFAAGPAGTVPVQFYDEGKGRYNAETTVGQVRVTLNGRTLDMGVPGVVQTVDGVDGRTLVPVRAIAEALGATVLWMADNRQVLVFNEADTIVLTLGSATAVVNGQSVQLPGGVPAGVVKQGGTESTMVPLRFVSEQLHATVDWDNDTFTAMVTAEIPEPEPSVTPTPEPTPSVTPGKPDLGMLLRVTPDDKAETVTLYLNHAPQYRVTDLGDRVAIDLLGVTIGSGKDGSQKIENPVIPTVRYAQHTNDLYPDYAHTTRVVLDLAKGCTYKDNVTVTGDANLMAVVISVKPPEGGSAPHDPPAEPLDPTAFTVVLDAGHGGSASGAFYEEIKEKDITFPITLRVEELLKEKGYNVVMTRTEDVYMDLYDRAGVANDIGADIFVSIHANASASNYSFQGTFTYYYPDSVEGEKLARAVQKGLVSSAGSIDRGLLTNDYVVLRETTMPACLVETGFMTGHEELMKLIDPDYQEKLAQGIAKGIADYLSTLPAKTDNPSPSPKASASSQTSPAPGSDDVVLPPAA